MGNNVVSLPYEDLAEIDVEVVKSARNAALEEFMVTINDWCEDRGIDVSTTEYRHQAAVIMTQLQIIMMGIK